MAQLTKERDHLFETIRTYRLLFETTRQLINEMQGTVSKLDSCFKTMNIQWNIHTAPIFQCKYFAKLDPYHPSLVSVSVRFCFIDMFC